MAPTLVGLPAEFMVPPGKNLAEAADEVDKIKAEHPRLDVSKARSIDELILQIKEIDLFAPFEDPIATTWGTLNWVRHGGERYQVRVAGPLCRETISIRKNEQGEWAGFIREFDRDRPLMDVRPSSQIEEVFAQTERWIRQERPSGLQWIEREAKWRKNPISAQQYQRLAEMNLSVDLNKLTCGQASDAIGWHAGLRTEIGRHPSDHPGQQAWRPDLLSDRLGRDVHLP